MLHYQEEKWLDVNDVTEWRCFSMDKKKKILIKCHIGMILGLVLLLIFWPVGLLFIIVSIWSYQHYKEKEI